MIKKLDIIDKIIEEKNKKPDLFKLILLNDDFTTMDFVVKILIMFLNKTSRSSIIDVQSSQWGFCSMWFISDRCAKTSKKIHNYSTLIINHLNVLLNIMATFTKSLEKSISNAFLWHQRKIINM